MTEALRQLCDICEAFRADPRLVLQPGRYRSQEDVSDRGVLLRELHRAGVKICILTRICPMSRRRIAAVLRNGHYTRPAQV